MNFDRYPKQNLIPSNQVIVSPSSSHVWPKYLQGWWQPWGVVSRWWFYDQPMANQNQCSEIQNAEGNIGRANLDATMCEDFPYLMFSELEILEAASISRIIFFVKKSAGILHKCLNFSVFSLATTPEVASWPGPTCSRDILASFSGFRKHDLPWAIKNSSVSKSMAWWHTLHVHLNPPPNY